MGHYYPEDTSKENLRKLIQQNVCAECGRLLYAYMDKESKVYIACGGQVHEGIVREYKPQSTDYESNIRRSVKLEEEVGVKKTQMLAKYEGVTSLDKVGAREVINTVFPEAPEAEVARAILLCVNYQLNPLMNHVYLIPFQRRERGEVVGTDWATIIGRGAKRLMASRRGPYSYIEGTPRVMTKEEQLATFGECDEDKLYCITKLQDPQTGATSVGYGFWPRTKPVYNKPGERQPNEPKGTDKGNSMFNMASGRSENQALDRLRPGEMPMNLPVMDEALAAEALAGGLDSEDYLETEEKKTETEDIIEGEARVIEDEKPKEKPKTKAQAKKEPPPALEPDEEPGPTGPAEKDEAVIDTDQLKYIYEQMAAHNMDLLAMSQYCLKEKGWDIRKLSELHQWQFDELKEYFEKP